MRRPLQRLIWGLGATIVLLTVLLVQRTSLSASPREEIPWVEPMADVTARITGDVEINDGGNNNNNSKASELLTSAQPPQKRSEPMLMAPLPSPCGVSYIPHAPRIFHPRNPKRSPNAMAEAGLFVSFFNDRLYATPLDGAIFDATSIVYIYFSSVGASAHQSVTFQLDDGAVIASSSTASPFDFIGSEGADNALALPFELASLSARISVPFLGCHVLRVEVTGDGDTVSVFQASFSVVDRPPQVGDLC